MQGRIYNSFGSLAIFLGVFFALQYGWERSRESSLERLIIDQITVVPAARSISLLWPDWPVSAQGHTLVSAQQRINILNGCEGLETAFMLMAALFAYSMTWQRRLMACTAGLLCVYVLNQLRIVVLWRIYQLRPDLFGLMHGTVLPIVLVALSLLFFLACLPREAPVQQ